jgi:hypothetical protein
MYVAGMVSIRFSPIGVMRKDLTFGVILGLSDCLYIYILHMLDMTDIRTHKRHI